MNECIICYDSINELNNALIKNNFSRQCECQFFIHSKCFKKWVDINHSCPICRTPILMEEGINIPVESDTTIIIHNESSLHCMRICCYMSVSIISIICIINVASSLIYLI